MNERVEAIRERYGVIVARQATPAEQDIAALYAEWKRQQKKLIAVEHVLENYMQDDRDKSWVRAASYQDGRA